MKGVCEDGRNQSPRALLVETKNCDVTMDKKTCDLEHQPLFPKTFPVTLKMKKLRINGALMYEKGTK